MPCTKSIVVVYGTGMVSDANDTVIYEFIYSFIYGSFEMNYTNKSFAKSDYIVL